MANPRSKNHADELMIDAKTCAESMFFLKKRTKKLLILWSVLLTQHATA
jgi:hypothetical protein